MHACIHACMHACMHAHKQTQTYKRVWIHTHLHHDRREDGGEIALLDTSLVCDRADARIRVHEVDCCVAFEVQHFVVRKLLRFKKNKVWKRKKNLKRITMEEKNRTQNGWEASAFVQKWSCHVKNVLPSRSRFLSQENYHKKWQKKKGERASCRSTTATLQKKREDKKKRAFCRSTTAKMTGKIGGKGIL